MGFRNCVQEFRGILLVWSCFKEFKAPIWRDTRVLEYQVFGVLELLSGFWSYSQGFGCTTRVLDLLSGFLKLLSRVWSYSQGFGVTPRVLELLSGVWSYSQGFKVAPMVLKLLPRFLSCSQGIWSYSQGFGVAPRVFELFSGFLSYSQDFWSTHRVFELLTGFWRYSIVLELLLVLELVSEFLELFPGFWSCPPPLLGFHSSSKSLDLLRWVWWCSQGFKAAPRVLEMLPGFLEELQLRFWVCSQGFGVAPRGVGLLLEYWRDKRRSDSP